VAEIQESNYRKESAAKALEEYKSATTIANSELPRTNPVRLGVALNFSVLYYEILNMPDRACYHAKLVLLMLLLLLSTSIIDVNIRRNQEFVVLCSIKLDTELNFNRFVTICKDC